MNEYGQIYNLKSRFQFLQILIYKINISLRAIYIKFHVNNIYLIRLYIK